MLVKAASPLCGLLSSLMEDESIVHVEMCQENADLEK